MGFISARNKLPVGNRSARRPWRRPQLDLLENRLVLSVADGTILVCNTPFVHSSAPLGIIGVNPSTGAQALVSTNDYFAGPLDIREAPDHALYVADYGPFSGNGAGGVIRVDPETGAQKLVASGGFIMGPDAIALMHGHIFVTAVGPFDGTVNNLVEIDPSTGRQRLVTSGGSLAIPIGLAPAPGDNIYVLDGGLAPGKAPAIFRVDLHTGTQTLITEGGDLTSPADIALAPDGNLVVAIQGVSPTFEGRLVRVNPETGAQSFISSDNLLLFLNGDTVDRNGQIYVSSDTDPPTFTIPTGSRIIAVNPVTGAQKLVSQAGYFNFLAGQVVFHTNNGGSDALPAGPSGPVLQSGPLAIPVDSAPMGTLFASATVSSLRPIQPVLLPAGVAHSGSTLRSAATHRVSAARAAIDSLFANWPGGWAEEQNASSTEQ